MLSCGDFPEVDGGGRERSTVLGRANAAASDDALGPSVKNARVRLSGAPATSSSDTGREGGGGRGGTGTDEEDAGMDDDGNDDNDDGVGGSRSRNNKAKQRLRTSAIFRFTLDYNSSE